MAPNINTMPKPTTARFTLRWWYSAAGIAAYAIGSLLLFHPFSPLTGSYLPRGGLGDPAQMVWFLGYTPHALSHGLNLFATNLIDYPTGVDLANNTSVPLLGILAWPITGTLGPIVSFNLLVRLGIFLSATSLYLVLGRWCRSRGACFVGGLCFGFGPYVMDQTISNTHLNLLFLPLFPPLVLIIDELITRQRWSWKKTGVLLGLCASAEMLIAPELLSDFGLVIITVIVCFTLRHPQIMRQKLSYLWRALASGLVVFGAICGYLIFEMVAAANHVRGAVYPVAHLQSFHNSIVETFLPSLQQLIASRSFSESLVLPTKDVNEIGGYLSIPLAIFVVITVIVFRRRSGVAPIAIGTAAAFVLSLGGSFHYGTGSFWLPESVLTHLPLLKSTIPGRFSFITLLGSCLLLAIGVDQLRYFSIQRKPTQRFAIQIALVLVVGVIVIALVPRLPFQEQRLVWPENTPAEIASHVTKGGVVLTYPYPTAPLDEAMAWQSLSGFSYTLMGGYATVSGPNGDGQEWPILQHPSEVQSYLTHLASGFHSRFPKVVPPTNSSKLCSFIKRFGVTDIVIFHRGGHVSKAITYLGAIPHRTTLNTSAITIYRVDHALANNDSNC